MPFVIAIVGRPNVGKSRLFNRLADTDRAIVHGEPGVTRDRQYARGRHEEVEYRVVDTGGMVPDSDDRLTRRMEDQATIAVEQADAVVLVVDGRTGLTAADRRIADRLRREAPPLHVAVNKVDPGTDPQQLLAEFYELGERLHPISAEHDRGIAELLEAVVELRPTSEPEAETERPPRCAVVGKPNVGKSTLVNALVGTDRLVTSGEPGTTRDAVDTVIERGGRAYRLVDTAGLRRKANVDAGIEEMAVGHAIRSIERADVALLMVEASEGVTNQDRRIADLVVDRGTACVVLVNKWDELDRHPETGDLYRSYLDRELTFLEWAPFHFISAKTERGLDDVFASIDDAWTNYRRRISTSPLNDFFDQVVAEHTPPTHKGRQVKVYYGTQADVEPPTFVIFTNYPEEIDQSYRRYLENRLRESYQFRGTPIRIRVRERD